MSDIVSYIGYHGTSKIKAESILENGFKMSCGDDEWLGKGVYFFPNDCSAAELWCKHYLKLKAKNMQVLKASISVESDQLLDLDTNAGHNFVIEYCKEYIKAIQEKSYAVKPDKHQLQCFILDLIPVEIKKVIYGSFELNRTKFASEDEKRLFKDYFDARQSQLCVRDLDCIEKLEEVM